MGPSGTRGHNLQLEKERSRHDLRKILFQFKNCKHVNSFPNDVVSAKTIKCYKSKLDEFWQNQDDKYDFQAEITGTRNGSNM